MQAIVQTGYGEPERVLRLGEVERPAVGPDGVLIRVKATSVNTADSIVVAGVGQRAHAAPTGYVRRAHARTGGPGHREAGRYLLRGRWCRGNSGGMFAGLPRMARAKLMGRSTNVKFVDCVVNRENLSALAAVLKSGDVRVVIDETYALESAPAAVAHMLGHHARHEPGRADIPVVLDDRDADAFSSAPP